MALAWLYARGGFGRVPRTGELGASQYAVRAIMDAQHVDSRACGRYIPSTRPTLGARYSMSLSSRLKDVLLCINERGTPHQFHGPLRRLATGLWAHHTCPGLPCAALCCPVLPWPALACPAPPRRCRCASPWAMSSCTRPLSHCHPPGSRQ